VTIVLQRSRRDDVARATPWTEDFPASWWAPILAGIEVEVVVRGSGAVRVIAVDGAEREVLAQAEVDGDWSAVVRTDAWEWMWLEGNVETIEWRVEEELTLPGVTAVVPTFGRPVEAASQTTALLAAEVVNHVVVIDQAGGLADDRAFAGLLSAEPERVVLVSQPNLGGSGGYARGMLESTRWPADAVFLGDDDALIEPESLRRMVVLQALAAARGARSIVGTGMLAAEQPDLLVSLAERVEPRRFWWCPADGLVEPMSVAARSSDVWQLLRPLHRADYAGWWGALLPPGAVADLGLPAPFFLKWDDAEYGLRARRRGWQVLTLPGVAVTHPTWASKGTASGWASWPMHRNRLATAAAYRAGRGVLLDSVLHQVKHVLSLQYGTAELWQAAARQVLDGPGWLGRDLLQIRGRAEDLLAGMPVVAPDAGADHGRLAGPVAVARALAGVILPVVGTRVARRIPADQLRWRETLGADHVVLDGPDGQVQTVLQRDPRRARALLRDVVVTYARLLRGWPALRRGYAAALGRVTTGDYWRRTIGLSGGADDA
jgi:galactofuranosylgalactofuranosylrhamnosyl-N-acetylglucosaminyl-diphospho-decaprenol beta-1,5/1,6-galactofuranosyltransferase